jgi:hypothetical protein
MSTGPIDADFLTRAWLFSALAAVRDIVVHGNMSYSHEN